MIGKIRSLFYGAAKVLGDVQAVKKGKVFQRIKNRIKGRIIGKIIK